MADRSNLRSSCRISALSWLTSTCALSHRATLRSRATLGRRPFVAVVQNERTVDSGKPGRMLFISAFAILTLRLAAPVDRVQKLDMHFDLQHALNAANINPPVKFSRIPEQSFKEYEGASVNLTTRIEISRIDVTSLRFEPCEATASRGQPRSIAASAIRAVHDRP
jgi:hypothetical protein